MPTAIGNGNIADADTILRSFNASGLWKTGLQSETAAAPSAGMVHVATDTNKLFVCMSGTTWTQVAPTSTATTLASALWTACVTAGPNLAPLDGGRKTAYSVEIPSGILGVGSGLRVVMDARSKARDDGGAWTHVGELFFGGLTADSIAVSLSPGGGTFLAWHMEWTLFADTITSFVSKSHWGIGTAISNTLVVRSALGLTAAQTLLIAMSANGGIAATGWRDLITIEYLR